MTYNDGIAYVQPHRPTINKLNLTSFHSFTTPLPTMYQNTLSGISSINHQLGQLPTTPSLLERVYSIVSNIEDATKLSNIFARTIKIKLDSKMVIA